MVCRFPLSANYRIGNCQSGTWRGQRPTRVVAVDGQRESCGGDRNATGAAGYEVAYAKCPVGITLVGGGYALTRLSPFKSQSSGSFHTNAPDVSMPQTDLSTGDTMWRIEAGGYPDFCFKPYALCAQ